MEKYYAFLKSNRIVDISVFESEDEHLAAQIAAEKGYDNAIWCGETLPKLHSFWNGSFFEEPTLEYLLSIKVISEIAEITTDSE